MLASADRFYFETISVPEPELRIQLMIFKQQFNNHVEDILSVRRHIDLVENFFFKKKNYKSSNPKFF